MRAQKLRGALFQFPPLAVRSCAGSAEMMRDCWARRGLNLECGDLSPLCFFTDTIHIWKRRQVAALQSLMPSLIIHGHFYQPPRENPWSGIVQHEPSAAPFHNWNERIHTECYQPNAFARINDSDTGSERVVNNYAKISFNFGPTLLTWLERNHAETYARIIDADRESALQHGSHGNAIAQAYGHAILPLCNERDLRTQIRWGIADFHRRFGRPP